MKAQFRQKAKTEQEMDGQHFRNREEEGRESGPRGGVRGHILVMLLASILSAMGSTLRLRSAAGVTF